MKKLVFEHPTRSEYNKTYRFTIGDIVRHKDTKCIGVVMELTSIEKINNKRNILGLGNCGLWYHEPYYKVLWGKDNVDNTLWITTGFPDEKWDGETTIIGQHKLGKPKKTLGVVSTYTKVSQLKGLFSYEVIVYKKYNQFNEVIEKMDILITEKGTGKEDYYCVDNRCTTAEPDKGTITFGNGIKSNDQVMTDYVFSLYNKVWKKIK